MQGRNIPRYHLDCPEALNPLTQETPQVLPAEFIGRVHECLFPVHSATGSLEIHVFATFSKSLSLLFKCIQSITEIILIQGSSLVKAFLDFKCQF